jgi:hypothetical protein
VVEFEGETQRIRIVAKAKAKQKVKNYKQGIADST